MDLVGCVSGGKIQEYVRKVGGSAPDGPVKAIYFSPAPQKFPARKRVIAVMRQVRTPHAPPPAAAAGKLEKPKFTKKSVANVKSLAQAASC